MDDKSKELLHLYHYFRTQRSAVEQRWRLLDAYDRGEFWKTLRTKLPPHQILPETNYVSFIKENIVNSVYAGTYRADVVPKDIDDVELARKVNAFIEYMWDKLDMQIHQLKAGERAALLNVGALQFGWDNDIIDEIKPEKKIKGELTVKLIDPMSLLLDPGVVDPYRGRAMIISDEVTIGQLENELLLAEGIKKWKEVHKNQPIQPATYEEGYYNKRQPTAEDKVVRLLTIYIRDGKKINQVWMLDDGFILNEKQDIGVSRFPIEILYATPPVSDSYGVPCTYKCLSNILTINMIDSIEATYAYASVRRTKIVDLKSGINVESFAKYGNDPDKLFMVNGNPKDVVSYVDLPELYANLPLLRDRLEQSIFLVTGVDLRYIGRDTGSVITTGGIDMMQARISMTDNTRIVMLEHFVKRVTSLILEFYIAFGGERSFPRRNLLGELEEFDTINFKDLSKSSFNYTFSAAPHLPKNRARLADAANMIMEKQMQYQMNPPILTQEEWLSYQDIPQKHLILQRIERDRQRDDLEEVVADITSFASMTQQGLDGMAAAQILADEKTFKRKSPKLGSTGGVGPFQLKQKG